MAIIKKFAPFQNLTNFQTFLRDTNPNSQYFRISEFADTFTGGKNGFLIEGSEFLKETTEVKIEILDVEGNPIYFEPGDGVPEYYEGNSKLISVHVYDDTPIGISKITILGELKNYVDDFGAVVPVPNEWKGVYNVKWEKSFQVNRNLNNESIVRFYKRPVVAITELIKPIFSKTVPTVTDTGYVHGISEVPNDGTDITTWRAGTLYKLRRTNGVWDRDVDENTITITNPTHTANITEVLNDTEVLVNTPYTINNRVSNFTSGSFSVTYSDFQNETIGESTLTGSFAKIDITQLKTFVGDVARVKVFRKSRNAVGDFQFVQESKLESTELLRDITTTSNTEIPYGRFDETNLSTYWVTSSDDHTVSIDSSVLSQAVKFDYDAVVGGVQNLITSQSFSISKDVEYTLNFKTLLSGSLNDTNKKIRAYFSSSNFTQDFTTISGSAIYRARQNVSQNIISENTGDVKLVFEVQGEDWYISNVSLKNAQDTSFSPDEFTLIQDIPRKLASETFDFRFEFYDINNNYIPVDVTAVGVFDGGNDFPTSGKLLTFESDRNAFRFSSGSVQNPTGQQIQFKLTQNNLTGSVTFASSAFDVDGNYLDPSDYSQYPGKLISVNPAGAIITINNFTGSRVDGLYEPFVGSIVYTASLENLEEFETVYRLEDGDNAPQLIVTSNTNQFIYEPTALEPKPAGQQITIRAQRKNLASLVTELTVNSGSNRPELTYVDTVNGIDTYTISATAFSSSFSQNNFDEVTYSFTGSDVFGNLQSDEITLSKVVNFDGVSITLSNESTAFRSNGKGVVLDNFDAGDGIVEVRIANKEIEHSNGLTSPNRFDIVSATATNVDEAYPSYLTNEYGIQALNADSGSLVLNIKYLAGDNSTSQSFQKKVNYTKNRIAGPSITIDTTNKTQNVDAKSTGVQLTSFDDSIITVREFYTGSVTTFVHNLETPGANQRKIESISITSDPQSVASDNGDMSLSYSNLPNATNSTQVGIVVTVTDSEGETRTISDSISLSKTLDSAPNVEFQVTPSSQAIPSNSRGSGSASPTNLTVTANEGGSSRTLTDLEVTNETNGITTGTPVLATGVIPITSTASDMDSDSGVVTISASALNTEGTTVTKTLNAIVSRVRSSAPVVDVSATGLTQTITANSIGSGSVSPQTITVSAVDGAQNVFDSVTITPNGGLSGNVSGNTITFTDTASDMNSDTETISIVVNYTDSEGTTGSKNLTSTISRVRTAAPSTDIRITPVAQSILSSSAAYATADDISVTVSEGGNDYTYSTTALSGGTSEANEFRITAQDGTNASVDGASVGTVSPPAITSDSGLNGTITVEYVNSEGVLFTGKTVKYDVSVSKEGINGNDAKTIGLSASSLIFTEATDGTVSPDYITLSINKQNTSEAVSWSTSPSVTLYNSATGGSSTTTGDTVYLRKGDFGSNTLVQITATCDGIDDSVSIARVVDGSSAITVTNSNPTHTFEADDYGEVQAYTNSGTDINVYEGATQLDYDGSGTTAGHWKISTSQSPSSTITIGTITDVTNTARVGVHSSMQDLTDSVLITYSITGKKLNGDSFSTLTTQALGKNKAPKPPLSDTAIKIESWDATPFDTSPGTTTAPTISASHYGLFTTGGSAITSTALRKYNTVGFLSLDGNAVSSNNFSTNINTYLLKTAEVGDIVVLYSDENNYGNYTLAAKTKVAATGDTTIQLTHISSAGRLTPNNLTYVGFGRVLIGPGVVYRGEYDSGATYYYSETRRDIVGYGGSYYLASNPSDSGTSNWGTPGSSTDWETFGAEFSSVATDILFAQDVYANRTVNIGSDGLNPVIALNSDHANSNQNPYISIGAANYGGNGVWLGFDGGTAKSSFVNGTTSFMKWNGSSLEIKGSITVTGGDAATQTQAQGYANTAQSNAESYADGIVESVSIATMDLTLSSNMEITNGRELKKTGGSAWAEQVYSGVGFTDGAFVSFKNSTANTNAYYMFGLNSDPTTNASYTSLDYAWYVRQGSTYNVRVNGASVTPDVSLPSVADGDVLAIFYDGSTVKWYINNTLYNTVTASNGLNLYLDSSFSTNTTTPCISWFEFGPAGQTNSSSKTDGEVGGWTIDSSAIYSGVKDTSGYTDASTGGITISATSGGSIHSRKFYIDTNGNAFFKGDVTGANGNFQGKITAGSMVLGNDAGGAGVDGIHIDANDYWYSDGSFSLGNGGVTWNGTTLTVQGDIVGSDIEGSNINGGTISGATLVGGSINVPNSTSPLFQVNSSGVMTATDANITGEITATSGLLGNWVVDPPNAGGSLKDDTGRIILNPTDKRISLFDTNGDLKAQVNASDELSPIGSGNIYISGIGTSTSAPAGVTSSPTSTAYVEGTPQYSTAQTFTISTAGEYQLNQLFDYSSPPSIDLSSKVSSLGTVSTQTGNPYGNITPIYPGAQYSSNAYGRGITQTLYLVIEDNTTNAVIAEIQCSQANARGGYSILNYYYATGTTSSTWVYASGYSSTGNAWSYQTSSPISSVINFPSTGTYRARYKSVIESTSGYEYYLSGTSNTGTYTYYTVSSSIGGVALSGLDSSVLVAKPSNFIEMSGGGFQAVTNSEQYVKINRLDANNSSWVETLLQVRGGKTVLQQPDIEDEVLNVSGKAFLTGQTTVGNSWYSGTFSDPLDSHARILKVNGLAQDAYTISSPGTTSSPKNLAYEISQGNSMIWLSHTSSTSRYYELPNQLNTGTFNPASTTNIPIGTTIYIFNKSDGDSVYIRGLLHGSSSDGFLEMVGGRAHICVFMGSSSAQDPSQNYKWIVFSTYDNTW